jgi:hypothetical protein
VASDRPAGPFGADGVGRVLDDRNARPVPDRVDAIHVHRPAPKVHWHERLGPRAYEVLGELQIDEPGVGLAVDEDRRRPELLDDVGAGREREGGYEHLVAAIDPGELQPQEQARRGGGETAHLGRSQALLECGLEGAHPWARHEPAGSQRRDDFGDLLFTDVRPREMQESRALQAFTGAHRPHRTPFG